ncbi:hypothetical protein GQX74_007593 [Glossina fuscipes]|nr:hypothetical protein GQX74_007593 [Glossina fuscipes]
MKPCAYDTIFEQYKACLISLRNAFKLSALITISGPGKCLLAFKRSSLRADRQRENTASPINVTASSDLSSINSQADKISPKYRLAFKKLTYNFHAQYGTIRAIDKIISSHTGTAPPTKPVLPPCGHTAK